MNIDQTTEEARGKVTQKFDAGLTVVKTKFQSFYFKTFLTLLPLILVVGLGAWDALIGLFTVVPVVVLVTVIFFFWFVFAQTTQSLVKVYVVSTVFYILSLRLVFPILTDYGNTILPFGSPLPSPSVPGEVFAVDVLILLFLVMIILTALANWIYIGTLVSKQREPSLRQTRILKYTPLILGVVFSIILHLVVLTDFQKLRVPLDFNSEVHMNIKII